MHKFKHRGFGALSRVCILRLHFELEQVLFHRLLTKAGRYGLVRLKLDTTYGHRTVIAVLHRARLDELWTYCASIWTCSTGVDGRMP
jgi:hypothetical protein